MYFGEKAASVAAPEDFEPQKAALNDSNCPRTSNRVFGLIWIRTQGEGKEEGYGYTLRELPLSGLNQAERSTNQAMLDQKEPKEQVELAARSPTQSL